MNRALLIGINKYWDADWQDLQHAESDCDKLAKALGQRCFQEGDIIYKLPENRRDQSIPATRNSILFHPFFRGVNRGAIDTLLVYYAGHGEESAGRSYLVPIDGVWNEPRSWISVARLLKQLVAIPARLRVLILDACRSGTPLGGKALPDSFDAELTRAKNVLVFSACGIREHSYESRREGGIFTKYWCEGLQTAPKDIGQGLSLFQVFAHASKEVQGWAKGNLLPPQTPCWWGQGISNNLFHKAGQAA